MSAPPSMIGTREKEIWSRIASPGLGDGRVSRERRIGIEYSRKREAA
jgi:hypothetical protein